MFANVIVLAAKAQGSTRSGIPSSTSCLITLQVNVLSPPINVAPTRRAYVRGAKEKRPISRGIAASLGARRCRPRLGYRQPDRQDAAAIEARLMLSDRSLAQAYRIAFNMRHGRAARNSDADILRWHYRHDSLDPQERIDRVVHRMNKEEDAHVWLQHH